MLEQYPISDLLTWMDEGTLVLNPDFQRRSVWQTPAKSYLIDTILRGRPMPNIYLRTKTNLKTRRNYREVVDGQQRLRTINEFAGDKIVLSKNAGEFAGLRYSDLDADSQQTFLTYHIGVVQLFNATDAEVFDVFHRINAYGLNLNRQELRHGKYQGAFRNAVADASTRWSILWEKYRVVGIGQRVRMADDELMAQMLGTLLEGVVDGGQPAIDGFYRKYDESVPDQAIKRLDRVIERMVSEDLVLKNTPLVRGPHLLMLFAAVAHALYGIPEGAIGSIDMPQPGKDALSDVMMARANLGVLSEVIEMGENYVPTRFYAFKYASAGTTQRMRSRKPRFLELYRALLPNPI
jgi:hypothetical protein